MLRAGTVVLPNSHTANHDPAAFPDPERFDVRRYAPGGSARPHLAFSHGPHFCLGNHLAWPSGQGAATTDWVWRPRPSMPSSIRSPGRR
ncbi:cytochrome P450 [Nonomuraea sp. NPDC051191]|uniref:cytochrome P450 n=1 Tax=Nonomuraea sp. NPDC051191 TaxID=3364372 RepID=UPI0037A153D0